MQTISFNDLPEAVHQLFGKLEKIERLLIAKNETQQDTKDLLTVQEAAQLLSLSVPTIYGLISRGEIPVMKRSKRCYFSRQELLEYLQRGRRGAKDEITAEVRASLRRKQRNGSHED
jgi:excisionase family DNA binding protein